MEITHERELLLEIRFRSPNCLSLVENDFSVLEFDCLDLDLSKLHFSCITVQYFVVDFTICKECYSKMQFRLISQPIFSSIHSLLKSKANKLTAPVTPNRNVHPLPSPFHVEVENSQKSFHFLVLVFTKPFF